MSREAGTEHIREVLVHPHSSCYRDYNLEVMQTGYQKTFIEDREDVRRGEESRQEINSQCSERKPEDSQQTKKTWKN